VPELEPLRADHAPAVLAFEQVNRSYFATTISDRGDDFFDHFGERHEELLALQDAGTSAFYLLVDEDGSILGRFNLVNFDRGTATLGFRVAQHAAGRGVATATVVGLCRLAGARHGLRRLKAATPLANSASQKVLAKAGFALVGPVEKAEQATQLGGKAGVWYERDLVPDLP
jgi:ribosomal-protein-alanine N-acetyltransferase